MSLSQRLSMTIVASILAVAVFLFGGGFTAYAAGSSLPGDALYPVKTSLENARISLTSDDAIKASLFLGFAGSRLDEIKSLIAEGRFDQVPQTANQFGKDIEQAREAINHLAENNPARAAELNAQAAGILKGFDDTLSAVLSSAPLDVQPVIQNAMNASSLSVGTNDNANTNEDINDANDNGNDINNNANANQDINDNNGNDNANVNQDMNGDHGNDNLNGNIDTNTNTNTSGRHGHGDGGGGGGDGGGGSGGDGGGGDGGGGGGGGGGG